MALSSSLSSVYSSIARSKRLPKTAGLQEDGVRLVVVHVRQEALANRGSTVGGCHWYTGHNVDSLDVESVQTTRGLARSRRLRYDGRTVRSWSRLIVLWLWFSLWNVSDELPKGCSLEGGASPVRIDHFS